MKALLLAVLFAVASLARAETPHVSGATGGCVDVMQTAEIDTYSMKFPGRTITDGNKGSIVARLRGTPLGPDTNPTAILTNHSADGVAGGSKVLWTIKPDQGCITAGCRAGNDYEIIMQPTDGDGNKPIANCFLRVQNKKLRVSE